MTTAAVMRGGALTIGLTIAAAVGLLTMGLASNPAAAQSATVTPLMTMPLSGDHSKEVAIVRVEYAPGGSTAAHTHHAQALLYVLEGSIVMQLRGADAITLSPGADLV